MPITDIHNTSIPDKTNRTTTLCLTAKPFIEPVPPGIDKLSFPVYCFLISNGTRHVVFDLGVRKDWTNLSPSTVSLIHNLGEMTSPTNVADILDAHAGETGISRADVDAVIWSHSHFDHTGDINTFPTSTDLVVGPGVKHACLPGYPSNPTAAVLDADLAGPRAVREVDFDEPSRKARVGDFNAYDFFGDGSFYLLDAPGHCPGHICGFARVSSSSGDGQGQDSFVFMGGDACHHPGALRPSAFVPLPESLPEDVRRLHGELQPGRPEHPFVSVSAHMFPDYENATDTLRKIRELDALDNVLVVLGHDGTLQGHLAFFPDCVDNWGDTDIKQRTRWLFSYDWAIARSSI